MEAQWNLHRYAALMRHWSREGPPAYVAVAAYLGFRRAEPSPADLLDGVDLVNFLGALPGGSQGGDYRPQG